MRRPAVLAAAALALAACGRKKPQGPQIQTAEVTKQDIVVDVEATGVVQPINAVQVRSKASGQIIKMPAELGAHVKPGDLLVQIDPRDVRNRYDQAVAALQAAQANIKVTKAQQDRAQELAKQGVITAPELETATIAYANAQSQLVTARTNLEIARVALEDATIRAPIAATIIEKDVSLGQVIASATNSASGGTLLLQMADLNAVMDSALVGESDIGNVRPGLTATIKVDAYPNRTFHGRVEKIAPQATVQQSVTMFPVLIHLDNQDGALMPGMNSDVSILVEQRANALAVPNDAVRAPRDAAAAAIALGLDPAAVREQLKAQRGNGGGNGAGGAGSAGRRGGTDGAGTAHGRLAETTASTGAVADPVQASNQPPRRRAGRDSSLTVRSGETPEAGNTRPHPGLVFVAQNGTFVPRIVMLGVGNYDVTQVLSGLQEGDRVALITAAMLQQSRSEFQQRIQNRVGLPGVRQQDSGNRRAGGGSRGGGG
ncbi:MAG TPA: efflux RND transporter periplasmic adaptor subunit [Gemmatimonadaceae bacterium]|nr:efflux RND transporter periplasmic adaptor subunit [Gemmatimonadaceae bacterium]